MAQGAKHVVVVVGCTRGLGRALFEWYAGQGHPVAGCGTKQTHVDSLQKAWPDSAARLVDIRNEGAVSSWLQTVAAKFGSIGLLICNAGLMPSSSKLWEVPAEQWSEAFDVNVLGTARVLRHCVPQLQEAGAKVVLISSRYGRTVCAGSGCYSATKWATESMAKTLALELRERGVTVVSLDPGVVNTEMLQAAAGPSCAEWCSQQRHQNKPSTMSPADAAASTGPFLLSLTPADTGRNLTLPGSPAAYFEIGVAYKDRPPWASGFGSCLRASDDVPPTKSRRLEASSPPALRFFISGVMLGSKPKLENAERDLAPQDYRAKIASVIRSTVPNAEIVEPLDVVMDRAKAAGLTMESLNQDTAMVRSCFEEVVGLAGECDVIVSNLPQASMGSAVELWEAKKAGRRVFTISPLADNWLLRSVTDHNFADLQDFEENLSKHLSVPSSSVGK